MTLLRKLLREGADPVVTDELTRTEFASAMAATHRAQPIPEVLTRSERDCSGEGPFTLLHTTARTILPAARQLVTTHSIRTPDALHLATALNDAVPLAGGEQVAMVTRDHRQASAARAHGFAVR